MRTTTDDSRTPTSHGERTRISANIQSSIYRAARSEAAAGGMSLDDFIVLTLGRLLGPADKDVHLRRRY